MQYHLTGERNGIVMAFRRDKSPNGSYNCHLREIDLSATYQGEYSSISMRRIRITTAACTPQ
jgi:hypothetical protein